MPNEEYVLYRKIVEDTLQGVFEEMRDGAQFPNVTLAIAARIALAEQEMLKQHAIQERYSTLLALVRDLQVHDPFFGITPENYFGEWDLGPCTYCGVSLQWVPDAPFLDSFGRQQVRGHHEDHHKEDCVVVRLREFMKGEGHGAAE